MSTENVNEAGGLWLPAWNRVYGQWVFVRLGRLSFQHLLPGQPWTSSKSLCRMFKCFKSRWNTQMFLMCNMISAIKGTLSSSRWLLSLLEPFQVAELLLRIQTPGTSWPGTRKFVAGRFLSTFAGSPSQMLLESSSSSMSSKLFFTAMFLWKQNSRSCFWFKYLNSKERNQRKVKKEGPFIRNVSGDADLIPAGRVRMLLQRTVKLQTNVPKTNSSVPDHFHWFNHNWTFDSSPKVPSCTKQLLLSWVPNLTCAWKEVGVKPGGLKRRLG